MLSAIYTSGVVAFTLNVVLWAIVLLLLYYSTLLRHLKCRVVAAVVLSREMWLSRAKVFAFYSMTNIAVVMGVNVAFVYGILYGGSDYQVALQVSLSLFKLTWGNLASSFMICRLDLYFDTEGKPRNFFALQLLVVLFNIIAIPCLPIVSVQFWCHLQPRR